MSEENVMMVYVTAPDRDQALKLATLLVEERLAACANVHGAMTSVYWWQGKLQQESEVAVILKTRADQVEALIRRVGEIHSYSIPCVVAWPIAAGNPDFLAWVREECGKR